jgi:hypothetical protein
MKCSCGTNFKDVGYYLHDHCLNVSMICPSCSSVYSASFEAEDFVKVYDPKEYEEKRRAAEL